MAAIQQYLPTINEYSYHDDDKLREALADSFHQTVKADQFITANSGDNITLSSAEQSILLSYTPDLGATGQLYVVAWVQNSTTKEVLNSGTQFDLGTATTEVSTDNQVALSPNPTTGKTILTFDKLTPQYLTVQNMAGQVLESVKLSNSTSYELNVANLASGVYIGRLTINGGSEKFFKMAVIK